MSSQIDGPPATADAPETRMPWGLKTLFRLVSSIERVGNKLPHPFLLFWLLAAVLAVVSAILAALGTGVVLPSTGEVSMVRSLLSSDGVAMIFGTALDNFAGFAPLPIIVTVILGVSVAEHSGVLTTLLRATIVKLPAKWVTFSVAFAGTMSHVMFDAAFIVVLPLAAMAFKAAGRSPVLGMMVAFVAIAGGYNASPLITPSDAIMSSLTTSAAQIVDADYSVTPVDNYFFSLASSLVISIFITLVVELVMAKHMNLDADEGVEDGAEKLALDLEPIEKKGMRRAGAALAVYVAVVVAALLPPRRRCVVRTAGSYSRSCCRTSRSSSRSPSSWSDGCTDAPPAVFGSSVRFRSRWPSASRPLLRSWCCSSRFRSSSPTSSGPASATSSQSRVRNC